MELTKEDLKNVMPDVSDNLKDFLIKLTSTKIKNFCNIEEVPVELKETQIQMCKDIYDLKYKEQFDNNPSNNIESIKRGDSQFEFTTDSEKLNNEKKILTELINSDNFIFNYESELVDFRNLRW